jgi:hypothetical protein
MKSVTTLFLLGVLTACGTPTPVPDDAFPRVFGKRIYGAVVVTESIPQETILASTACAKRDALCMLTLQQARDLQFATVSIYDTFAFLKVFVPKNLALANGDIIEIQVNIDPKLAPVFTALGARYKDRSASCDWVDGSMFTRKGGVICNGWSYRDIK